MWNTENNAKKCGKNCMTFAIASTQWYVLPTGLIKTQKIIIEDFVSLRFRS